MREISVAVSTFTGTIARCLKLGCGLELQPEVNYRAFHYNMLVPAQTRRYQRVRNGRWQGINEREVV